jgi:putative PIN family toxin of toxin-antitoxin system
MPIPAIVIDTNVLVSGLRSRRGASFRLLSLIGSGRFEINLSVPLVMEYEDVLSRPEVGIPVDRERVGDLLDFLCSVARHHEIFFLWRPLLADPGDDMVLELAVKAGCTLIVTHNRRHFAGCEKFRIQAMGPGEFLKTIGEHGWAR